MPISDTKKVQTMVNVVAQQMLTIRAAVATMKQVRVAFQTISPSVTGTVLEGNVAALNQSLNALDTESGLAVWDTLIAGIVESHRNGGLDG